MDEESPTSLLAIVVAALLAIALVTSGFYGSWMYGDWKCGMPGVHCRKVTK